MVLFGSSPHGFTPHRALRAWELEHSFACEKGSWNFFFNERKSHLFH